RTIRIDRMAGMALHPPRVSHRIPQPLLRAPRMGMDLLRISTRRAPDHRQRVSLESENPTQRTESQRTQPQKSSFFFFSISLYLRSPCWVLRTMSLLKSLIHAHRLTDQGEVPPILRTARTQARPLLV